MVKVEMQDIVNEADLTRTLAFAFESSDESGLGVLDALHFALMSDAPKRCGYISSNRLVVHVKVENPVEM